MLQISFSCQTLHPVPECVVRINYNVLYVQKVLILYKICFVKMQNIFKKCFKVRLWKLLWFSVVFIVALVIWKSGSGDKNIIGDPEVANYPVILWWTPNFPGNSGLTHCPNNIKCHVFSDRKKVKGEVGAYLFYASGMNFNDLPLPRRPRQIIWALYHEESPRNVEELLHEQALSLFNFSSTFSRLSDVPFPLQYLHKFDDIITKKYFIETSEKNKFLKKIAPIMYLQSDCTTSTERDEYVKELMKFVKIDSYGGCLKNRDMPARFQRDYLNNLNEDGILKFIARYKFVIAIENGVCNDYVTEKFWRAIKVGSIPIYFGSPYIRDWFPNNKSAILLGDFPTPKILSKHIESLLNNDRLYEEYLEHKTKQIVTNRKLLNELRIRPYQLDEMKTVKEFECYVCKKLHKKIYDKSVAIVNKRHYDCPKPISALTLSVNPLNSWVSSWEIAEMRVKEIYKTIINH